MNNKHYIWCVSCFWFYEPWIITMPCYGNCLCHFRHQYDPFSKTASCCDNATAECWLSKLWRSYRRAKKRIEWGFQLSRVENIEGNYTWPKSMTLLSCTHTVCHYHPKMTSAVLKRCSYLTDQVMFVPDSTKEKLCAVKVYQDQPFNRGLPLLFTNIAPRGSPVGTNWNRWLDVS